MPQIHGIVQQAPPSPSADGTAKQVRLDRYGGIMTYTLGGGFNALAAEGSYFRACNPTMGTGIGSGIQASFSDTANVTFVIRNLAIQQGESIYMDYIRLNNTVAGASTTSSHLAVVLDTGLRYSTGGTQLFPVNLNSALSNASNADIRYACTALAAINKRQVTRAVLKTQAAPCWTVGDQVFINFGSNDSGMGLISGTAAIKIAVDCGPVVIAPNTSMLVHIWNVANATTAPSWEMELGWWER